MAEIRVGRSVRKSLRSAGGSAIERAARIACRELGRRISLFAEKAELGYLLFFDTRLSARQHAFVCGLPQSEDAGAADERR